MTTTHQAASPVHQDSGELPRLSSGVLFTLCALKFVLHLFTSVRHYGYFRDELYYLDLARHLDWGYVDCAPLVAVYARIALLLGGSLAVLRILAALAGTALVALSILIARELGGGRYAQFLAGLAVLVCPGILLMDSLMTMNAFEPLFWMAAILVLARLLRTGNSRLWIWFGLLIGLGIENKHSTVFFGLSVAVALLVTKDRREFLRSWFWIGFAIILALAAPNLIWQIRHHFPTLEDLGNVARTHKNVILSPLAFLKEQIVDIHPILFPIWLSGVLWLLWQRRWRVLGLTFVVFFSVMELIHAKNYYLFPIYPLVLAAGAAALVRWLTPRSAASSGILATWTRIAIVVILVTATVPFIPFSTWMLSPERFLAYEKNIGFTPSKAEVNHAGPLPQPMGDQFGWPEMARQVAEIYNSLPPDERAKTGILAGNYGEAGAIDMFGPAYGLPRAISLHQNHWYWGPPAQHYDNFITLQSSLDDVKEYCTSYQAYEHTNPYGMAEENTPIYLCRGAKFELAKVWPRWKHWN